MKKTLCAILALAMIMSLSSFVYADDATSPNKSYAEEHNFQFLDGFENVSFTTGGYYMARFETSSGTEYQPGPMVNCQHRLISCSKTIDEETNMATYAITFLYTPDTKRAYTINGGSDGWRGNWTYSYEEPNLVDLNSGIRFPSKELHNDDEFGTEFELVSDYQEAFKNRAIEGTEITVGSRTITVGYHIAQHVISTNKIIADSYIEWLPVGTHSYYVYVPADYEGLSLGFSVTKNTDLSDDELMQKTKDTFSDSKKEKEPEEAGDFTSKLEEGESVQDYRFIKISNLIEKGIFDGEVVETDDGHKNLTFSQACVEQLNVDESSIGLKYNGEDVAPSNFTSHTHHDGSITVTFSNSYLNSLGTGEHVLFVMLNGVSYQYIVKI